MGYASEDPLSNDVATVTGRTPSELRKLSAEGLIAIVIDHLSCSARACGGQSFQEREVLRPVYPTDLLAGSV